MVTEFGVSPFFLSIAVDTAVAVGDAAAASKKKKKTGAKTPYFEKKKWENPNSVSKKELDFLGGKTILTKKKNFKIFSKTQQILGQKSVKM